MSEYKEILGYALFGISILAAYLLGRGDYRHAYTQGYKEGCDETLQELTDYVETYTGRQFIFPKLHNPEADSSSGHGDNGG